MTDNRKQDNTGALVHWTYSREEWKRFVRWKKMKKSFLHYILHRLWPASKAKTP
ncbi:MAG: hypothetical protein WDO16_23875 [Bacteroidota bacterium]